MNGGMFMGHSSLGIHGKYGQKPPLKNTEKSKFSSIKEVLEYWQRLNPHTRPLILSKKTGASVSVIKNILAGKTTKPRLITVVNLSYEILDQKEANLFLFQEFEGMFNQRLDGREFHKLDGEYSNLSEILKAFKDRNRFVSNIWLSYQTGISPFRLNQIEKGEICDVSLSCSLCSILLTRQAATSFLVDKFIIGPKNLTDAINLDIATIRVGNLQ